MTDSPSPSARGGSRVCPPFVGCLGWRWKSTLIRRLLSWLAVLWGVVLLPESPPIPTADDSPRWEVAPAERDLVVVLRKDVRRGASAPMLGGGGPDSSVFSAGSPSVQPCVKPREASFLDESPRWLIVRGQRGRARRVLEKAARWNKVTLPPEDHLHHLMTQITGEQKDGTCDGREERVEPVAGRERRGTHRVKTPCGTCLGPKLFSNRGITTITLVMCFVYLATSLVFDGLNLSGELYSDNIFLYLILGGLMEIPGNSLTVPIINRYGRRGPLAACFVLCGVMVLALAFIPTGMWQLVLALAMLGKLFISTAFQIIYVYSNELFPTEVRVQGVETGSAVGQLGAIVVPYISIYMVRRSVDVHHCTTETTVARNHHRRNTAQPRTTGPVIWWLPSAVFGSASVMAAASLLALNETVDQDLPETIAQLVSPARKTTLEEEKCVATSGAACVEGDL
ncbi:organic cation transporter protein-like [Procambarus clarkii]|uniref:organic cation transporter protein-like n=1 Tax=Procambarus clarkii TaxID=6728 RepID=UPI003742367B